MTELQAAELIEALKAIDVTLVIIMAACSVIAGATIAIARNQK